MASKAPSKEDDASSKSPANRQKRAFRALNQDGLGEILAGLTFFLCSAFVTNPSLLVLVVIPALVFVPGLDWLRQRLTFPRIGYAKLAEEESASEGRTILVVALVGFGVYVLALVGFGVANDVAYWRRWAPALAGALCCGGFLISASKTGLARHYLYIAAGLLGGIVFSLIRFERPYENVQMFLLALAGLMVASGLAILARFLRAHPPPAAGESDGRA